MASPLLPPNSTSLEHAIAQMINTRLQQVNAPIADALNPQQCPLAMLPWLAWACDVEFFSSIWSESQQRAAIAGSWHEHNIMGTPASMRHALAMLGYAAVKIIEYGSYYANGNYQANGSITASGDGLAYHYDVVVDTATPSYQLANGNINADGQTKANGYTAAYSAAVAAIRAVIAETANARSHLRRLMYAVIRADGAYIANGVIRADGGLIYG